MNTSKSENSSEAEVSQQNILAATPEEIRSADRSSSDQSYDMSQSADRGMEISDEKEEECLTVKLQKAIDKNIAESAQVHFRALREAGEAWEPWQIKVLELQVGRRSDRLQEMIAMTEQFDHQLQSKEGNVPIRQIQLKIKAYLIQRQQDTVEFLLRDSCKNCDEETVWALRFSHTESLLKMGADRIEMAMASLQNIRSMTESSEFQGLDEDIRDKRLQSVSSLIHSAIRSQVKADRLATAVAIVSEYSAIVAPSTYIINLLLEGCVRTGEWNTAEKIMQQNSHVERDVQTQSSLIKCQSKAGEIHMALETLHKMQDQGITPDEVLFNSLLDGCSKSGRSDLLMKVQRDMRKLDISPSSVTYNSLIDGLVRVGKVEEAWDLFDEMRSLGLEQDNFTQSSLIKGIKGHNHQQWFQKSIELFEKIKTEGFKADEILQNCLLDACVATKNFKVALSQLEEMKADERVRPDAITQNTLIKGCALMRNMTLGDKLLREMKTGGLDPNDISYNTMIDLAVRVDDLDKAWSYLEEMKLSNIQPDSFTQSTLIKGIKNTKRQDKNPNSLAKAFSLLEDLQNEGLQADEVLFNCLIDACVKFRDIKKAEEAQHTMLKSKIVPSSVTFGILIKGYGNTGFLDKAFEIFNTFLKKKNIRPNDVTQGCLLDACVKSGDTKRAMEVQDMMMADNIKMNTILQTTLIKSHSKDKNLSKALDIFDLMSTDERTMPNNVTFNSLIDCAVRCDNAKVARDLFLQMRERHIQPDLITFSTLAKGLCRWEQLNDALDLLRQMKELNIKPDEVLLNTLLEGCTKKGKIDLALRLFEEMKSARIKPSNVTFSILIKLQGKHRKMDKAMEVLELMKDIGVKPGTVVFTCLIKQAVATKNVKIAMDIQDRMRRDHVRGDRNTFMTLVQGLMEVDSLGDACSVLVDSLNENVLLDQERQEEVLTKVVEQQKEITQGATILKLAKKQGMIITQSLEQSLTRLMVNSALSDNCPEQEVVQRTFGTQITNTYSNDSKNHYTPNDYYNGKTKNRFLHNSDNKSPIQKAFDGVSNRPQRFKNNKKMAQNIKPYDKENVSQDTHFKSQDKSYRYQNYNDYSEQQY